MPWYRVNAGMGGLGDCQDTLYALNADMAIALMRLKLIGRTGDIWDLATWTATPVDKPESRGTVKP